MTAPRELPAPSLKLTLTRRLAIGLLLIGIAGAVAAYVIGTRFASRAYDRSLFDDVEVLANQVRWAQGSAQITLSSDALIWLLADEGDEIIYRVTDLGTRRVLATNGNLGDLPDLNIEDDKAHFRSITVKGIPLRIAYLKHQVGPAQALVEIAETTRKRVALSRTILIGVASMMSIIILVAVALVWSGVGMALAPLKELEADAARRSIGDMQPLDPRSAPAEARGLIEAINHMVSEVAQAIAVQRHFLANAAHQLKTPIAGLRLQAQLALKADPDGPASGSMREVERSATYSAHLIEQLLTLARAEAGDDSLPSADVDLARVARTVIERRLPDAISRRIDLGFESDHGACTIVANEVLIGELLGNLVDNGLRYGREGGHVTVTLRSADRNASPGGQRRVILAVSDDGAGLPLEQRELVFRRFWRSDASIGEGAGLGLAIVKEIAERYGGTVSIASRPEVEGTRVEVSFVAGGGARNGARTT